MIVQSRPNQGRDEYLAAAGQGKRVIGATGDPGKVYAFQSCQDARVACAAALLSNAWTIQALFTAQMH